MTASALLGGAALAADLPARTPPAIPGAVAPALPLWEGFYTGMGIGYQSTRARSREPGASGRYTLDGVTSSSFIGRNWQFGSLVGSLEGDIGIHETKGRLPLGGPTTGAQGDHLWSAGVKGRLGYAFGAFLPYVSAGFAFTEYNQHSLVVNQDSDVNRHVGYSLGAGLEYAWTRGFSTRLDYEYVNYDGRRYVHDGVRHDVDLSSQIVRASAVWREVPGSLPGGLVAPARGGSYLGVIGNYGNGAAEFRRPAVAGSTDFRYDGMEAGLFGGADLNLGTWFVGYDSFVMGSDADGTGRGRAGRVGLDVLWTGATRGRVGTTMGAFSPYLAAGFTLQQVNAKSLATRQQDAEMAYGGTIGVGVDYALTDRWFARAEYAYSRYAKVEPRVDAALNALDLDRHDIKFGLGYRLGEGFGFWQ